MNPTFHAHRLDGCASRPLGSYLKALGVLRVVSEQADPDARGYWAQGTFVLLSRLDRGELLRFFLAAWEPGAFLSPWNKGSGLLGEDKKGVMPVERSTAPRFGPLREAIAGAKELTAAMETAVQVERDLKAESNRIEDKAARERLREDPAYRQRLAQAARDCKRLKDDLQPECQRRWRGPALRWLRAAVVVTEDGGAVFPALLGTGGNDGKLDFTNNALQRLGDLFDLQDDTGRPAPLAEAALHAALFGLPARGLVDGGIGQFAPAASGGANATSGALAASSLNPWDLPLLLEGAVLFTAGTSRRVGGAGSERTVAPFSSRSVSAGYGSASVADESARGEQWMPLWSRPWTVREVEALLSEGRCQVGSKPSESSTDVAAAIARLGVARGVTAFERYGYIERNGKSNYAVPLGRWEVRPEPLATLLDDLHANEWWERLRRAARDEHAPGSLRMLDRRLTDAVLDVLAHGGTTRWQGVILALADVEAQLVDSGTFTVKHRLQPIPKLSSRWIPAVDDGEPAVALALALAGAGRGEGRQDGLRAHWLPLDRFGKFAVSGSRLVADPRVVATGRDPTGDLVRIVQRRLVEGTAGGQHSFPIAGRRGWTARIGDVSALLLGEVDLDRTVRLARGLAAVEAGPRPARARPTRADDTVDSVWAAIRLCHLPADRHGVQVPADPAIVRLLAAGDAARAMRIAVRRLRSSGVGAPLREVAVAPQLARRMAASLAFPLSAEDVRSLVVSLDPSTTQESRHDR